ncbi:hypothetical protein F5141DRAFT_1208368 [Pisolithus sp. B1]|nr:hypothetical protein F5141DRAFT_1208368 [Pisolithus sp. B1]
MLHAKLDCEITRVNTEKDAELVALTQKFSHIRTEKEAELAALAQKFEGALHQVKALNWSQRLPHSTQMHVSSTSSATPRPISRSNPQEEVGQGVPPREVTASSVAEEVIRMRRMDAVGHLYSTPHHKANSRKHHQLAVVKNEIMSDKERNDNLEHIRELFSHVFSVTGDGDFLSYELPSHEIKVIWNKGRPQRLNNDILETPTEVATRLMQGKIDNLKTAQKDMQRVAKFQLHSITMKSFLHTELAWGTKDKDVWQWLSKVIDHLGNDGMSSEDSEEEDMQTIFQVHGMLWRHDINKELQFIDSKHKDPAISSPRGAKPVKQIRPPNPLPSSCQAVHGLPVAFYKPQWLEKNPIVASDEVFNWTQFIVQGV